VIRWWSVRLWGAHLLGIVAVAVAAGLGVWQYDAWQAHRAAQQVDLTHATPVPLTEVLGPDDPFPAADVGRPVRLRGHWLPGGTVLVTGREDARGRAGRWVVTPLSVGDTAGAPALPVVRGWVPDSTGTEDLPPVPTGEVATTGWLQPPEGTGAPDHDPSDDVLPQLRTADIVQRVDVDLYGAYAIAQEPSSTDAAGGLAKATPGQLPPADRFTGLRNFLYALEWWVFAAFAAFIWWRHVRDTTRPPAEEEPGAEDPAAGAVPSEP
jgi:cytochrome oxidase assembly protein ShyY1